MSKRTLLAVLAHPDDESFGMGGTLAYYASRGVEVHLICATRGEVGEAAPELLDGFKSVAELRESELRCAASHLGLTGVHFLDYRDSGMPGSPDNKHPQALAAQSVVAIAERIVHYMRELKPQVVVTFDPIGGYHHPDHIAIQQATVHAFETAIKPDFTLRESTADLPQRLFFLVYPKRILKVAVAIMALLGKNPHKFGANGDIDVAAFAATEFPIHARIDIHSVLKKKEQAALCHASQGGGRMNGSPLAYIIRRFSSREAFMRAYPPPRPKEKVSNDLFLSLQGN